jgi:hypothetical protein
VGGGGGAGVVTVSWNVTCTPLSVALNVCGEPLPESGVNVVVTVPLASVVGLEFPNNPARSDERRTVLSGIAFPYSSRNVAETETGFSCSMLLGVAVIDDIEADGAAGVIVSAPLCCTATPATLAEMDSFPVTVPDIVNVAIPDPSAACGTDGLMVVPVAGDICRDT